MIYDLFQAIMNDINNIVTDIMNGITNDKKGHNIMNDIEQLCISQTTYLLQLRFLFTPQKRITTVHAMQSQ